MSLNSLFAAWTRRWESGPRSGVVPVIRATVPADAVEPLPIPSVDYEAHYDAWDTPAHAPMRALVRHSGGLYRMDRDVIGGLVRTTSFNREDSESAIVIAEAGTARAVFHVADISRDAIFDSWGGKNGTRTAEAEMIGERCVLWKLVAAGKVDVCVTGDGIPLYAARARTPTIPLMRALHLQRRRQDPALFALPSGIVPQDVSDFIALSEELESRGLLRL